MHRIILIFLFLLGMPVKAADAESLQQLLEMVKQERTLEKKELEQREERFKKARNKQKKLLETALSRLQSEETRSEKLKQQYEQYDLEISRQNLVLKEKTGALGELDGVVKQIAGDMDSIIDSSLVSTQKSERDEILDLLSSRKELPSLQELEDLWLLAMDEMVESGRITRYTGNIVTAAGNEIQQEVTRVGVFNAVSAGRFLRNLPETGKLIEPGRQPGPRYQEMARKLETAGTGFHTFPIDPTRGAMLALLVQVPDLKNRIEQGGIVGYVIIAFGLIGLLIALERFLSLSLTGRKVQKQLKSNTPGNNPLGRIMQVYKSNTDVDTETLSLKLDEAIIKEMPKIQRGLSMLALLAAVAPLLGLLGTVTGIIETFQSITLYGTGDPRVMSGGISQALVTTVMGLMVAIPLLLLHSFLASKSKTLVQILDENSSAIVARLAETRKA